VLSLPEQAQHRKVLAIGGEIRLSHIGPHGEVFEGRKLGHRQSGSREQRTGQASEPERTSE